MFDPLVDDLSQRYGLGDRGRDLFGLLMAYVHNDRRGGFTGFIEGFREQGHGELVSSWLGNPDAGGLNASDVGTVFGQGLLNDWGGRLGASRATVAAAIAGVLPRLVAELTPGGRIPGGFAPLAPALVAQARPATAVTPVRAVDPDSDAGALRVRPGVDGLLAGDTGHDERPEPRWNDARREAAHDAPATHEPARFEPPYRDGHRAASREPGQAVTSLRRDPVFGEESPAVRTPVQARRDQEAAPAAPPVLDPAEQRVADMAAAFERGPRSGTATAAADARPDSWRPAVHPPRPKRRGLGAFGWLVLLLAIVAVAGWYAWSQGMLAPYILQSGLPILPAP